MKNILLVIDMQNDFIDGALGSEASKALVPRVYEKIKKFDGSVISTMDTHYDDYLTTPEGKKLPIRHCIFGTPGWDLNPDIARILRCKGSVDDYYIKNTFGSTDLAIDLADAYGDKDDVRIELVGLVLNICVVSNALLLKAYMPNAKIAVDVSCSEATSPEDRAATISVLKSCQIDIIGM